MSPAVEHCGIHSAATCSLIKLFLLVENPSRYHSVHARLIPRRLIPCRSWRKGNSTKKTNLNQSAHPTTILFSWLTCLVKHEWQLQIELLLTGTSEETNGSIFTNFNNFKCFYTGERKHNGRKFFYHQPNCIALIVSRIDTASWHHEPSK